MINTEFNPIFLGALIDEKLLSSLTWSLLITRIPSIFNGYLYGYPNRRIYPHFLKIFGKEVKSKKSSPKTDRTLPAGPTGEINTAFQDETFWKRLNFDIPKISTAMTINSFVQFCSNKQKFGLKWLNLFVNSELGEMPEFFKIFSAVSF